MRINGADYATGNESTRRTEMFRRADQDSDGKITKEELTNAGPRGKGAIGLDIDALFSQIDSNQNGSIDESENDAFLSSMSSRASQRPSPADFAHKLFEKADGDGDGRLTQAEMKSALPKDAPSSEFDKLFGEADEDGDGVISQGELEASVAKRMAETMGTYTRNGETTDVRGPRIDEYA